MASDLALLFYCWLGFHIYQLLPSSSEERRRTPPALLPSEVPYLSPRGYIRWARLQSRNTPSEARLQRLEELHDEFDVLVYELYYTTASTSDDFEVLATQINADFVALQSRAPWRNRIPKPIQFPVNVFLSVREELDRCSCLLSQHGPQTARTYLKLACGTLRSLKDFQEIPEEWLLHEQLAWGAIQRRSPPPPYTTLEASAQATELTLRDSSILDRIPPQFRYPLHLLGPKTLALTGPEYQIGGTTSGSMAPSRKGQSNPSPDEGTEADYQAWRMNELRNELEVRGINADAKSKKKELVNLLFQYDAEREMLSKDAERGKVFHTQESIERSFPLTLNWGLTSGAVGSSVKKGGKKLPVIKSELGESSRLPGIKELREQCDAAGIPYTKNLNISQLRSKLANYSQNTPLSPAGASEIEEIVTGNGGAAPSSNTPNAKGWSFSLLPKSARGSSRPSPGRSGEKVATIYDLEDDESSHQVISRKGKERAVPGQFESFDDEPIGDNVRQQTIRENSQPTMGRRSQPRPDDESGRRTAPKNQATARMTQAQIPLTDRKPKNSPVKRTPLRNHDSQRTSPTGNPGSRNRETPYRSTMPLPSKSLNQKRKKESPGGRSRSAAQKSPVERQSTPVALSPTEFLAQGKVKYGRPNDGHVIAWTWWGAGTRVAIQYQIDDAVIGRIEPGSFHDFEKLAETNLSYQSRLQKSRDNTTWKPVPSEWTVNDVVSIGVIYYAVADDYSRDPTKVLTAVPGGRYPTTWVDIEWTDGVITLENRFNLIGFLAPRMRFNEAIHSVACMQQERYNEVRTIKYGPVAEVPMVNPYSSEMQRRASLRVKQYRAKLEDPEKRQHHKESNGKSRYRRQGLEEQEDEDEQDKEEWEGEEDEEEREEGGEEEEDDGEEEEEEEEEEDEEEEGDEQEDDDDREFIDDGASGGEENTPEDVEPHSQPVAQGRKPPKSKSSFLKAMSEPARARLQDTQTFSQRARSSPLNGGTQPRTTKQGPRATSR